MRSTGFCERKFQRAGVIAASGGNHGAAVAYAAQQLGLHAEIFVPATTPAIKVERLKQYGAQVVVGGANYAEAFAASTARASESGALAVHAYDEEEVIAGQGTLGHELARQAPELDTVFVAVGGGGLIGGIAAWYRGDTKVIAVEPERARRWRARSKRGGRSMSKSAAWLPIRSVHGASVSACFPIAQQFVDRVVLVSDEEIRAAQKLLWDRLRILAEPGGATALAGLLSAREGLDATQRIGVVVCGGNTDPANFA